MTEIPSYETGIRLDDAISILVQWELESAQEAKAGGAGGLACLLDREKEGGFPWGGRWGVGGRWEVGGVDSSVLLPSSSAGAAPAHRFASRARSCME